MNLDDEARKWKALSTHREKAEAERKIRKYLKVPTKDLSLVLEGASSYELVLRNRFLRSGSEYVWSMLEEGVQYAKVREMVKDAEAMAASTRRPMDDILRDLHIDSKKGGPSREWDAIRRAVESLVRSEMSGIHELEREGVVGEAMADLDVLVRGFRAKIRSRSRSGLRKDWSADAERAERRKFCADMREIGLDPPRPGKPVDMAEVKRAYRNMAKDHHPDLNKSEAAKNKFNAVNEAYQRILQWSENQKGRE